MGASVDAPIGAGSAVTLSGEAGVGFTFRGQALQDVSFGTAVSGSVNIGSLQGSASINSGVALEGGLKFDAGATLQLPGGGGGQARLP